MLTPLEVDDAGDMVDVLADPALYRFTGGSPPDRDELEKRYRAQVAGPPDRVETWLNWIVRLAPAGEAIGFVQATVSASTADIAWLIGVGWQSQGYATEAAAAMSRWLSERGVEVFTAHIHPQHVASRRIAATLGLAPTGEVDADGEDVWRRPPPP